MAIDVNDTEVKEAIKVAVDEATSALAANNKKLLAELKEARKGREIDPAEFQALQETLSATETKLVDALKIAKKATTEAEVARKALEGEAGITHKLVVQNGLTAALIEGKVKPEYMDAVVALLSPLASLKAEGDNRVAVVGDKPLADYVGEWVKSDKGKHYVAAPVNEGGGAQGGGKAPVEGLEKITNPAARLTAINLAGKK